jgi:hypothetical protein
LEQAVPAQRVAFDTACFKQLHTAIKLSHVGCVFDQPQDRNPKLYPIYAGGQSAVVLTIGDFGNIPILRLFSSQDIYGTDGVFVTRAKSNTKYKRQKLHRVDKSTGLRSDYRVVLTGVQAARDHPAPLRRVAYYDVEGEVALRRAGVRERLFKKK